MESVPESDHVEACSDTAPVLDTVPVPVGSPLMLTVPEAAPLLLTVMVMPTGEE